MESAIIRIHESQFERFSAWMTKTIGLREHVCPDDSVSWFENKEIKCWWVGSDFDRMQRGRLIYCFKFQDQNLAMLAKLMFNNIRD